MYTKNVLLFLWNFISSTVPMSSVEGRKIYSSDNFFMINPLSVKAKVTHPTLVLAIIDMHVS